VTFLSDSALKRLRRAADTPETAGTRYAITGELGRGGMGTVYEAHDSVLDRPVALKVLTLGEGEAAATERMLTEARVMAGLEHPGIVPVHDAGTLPDGRVYYAMKLVRGELLSRWAADRPLPDRLRAFQKVCEAAAFAHARGVIHRDLKPENVMIGSFGEVMVLDWGVSRRREEPAEPDGVVLGTRAYMAPEQAAGRTDLVTERTDVYALGAMLAFLLGSERPATPKALVSVAARAMSREPEDRYRDAADLASEVERFLDGGVPSAHRESFAERARRFAARHRTAILLVLAYLVVRAMLVLFLHR
jgi:serine/threonine protein kinase